MTMTSLKVMKATIYLQGVPALKNVPKSRHPNLCSAGHEAAPRAEPGDDAAGAQLEPDDADQAAADHGATALVHHPRSG